jgi:hypothetical protein
MAPSHSSLKYQIRSSGSKVAPCCADVNNTDAKLEKKSVQAWSEPPSASIKHNSSEEIKSIYQCIRYVCEVVLERGFYLASRSNKPELHEIKKIQQKFEPLLEAYKLINGIEGNPLSQIVKERYPVILEEIEGEMSPLFLLIESNEEIEIMLDLYMRLIDIENNLKYTKWEEPAYPHIIELAIHAMRVAAKAQSDLAKKNPQAIFNMREFGIFKLNFIRSFLNLIPDGESICTQKVWHVFDCVDYVCNEVEKFQVNIRVKMESLNEVGVPIKEIEEKNELTQIVSDLFLKINKIKLQILKKPSLINFVDTLAKKAAREALDSLENYNATLAGKSVALPSDFRDQFREIKNFVEKSFKNLVERMVDSPSVLRPAALPPQTQASTLARLVLKGQPL